MAAELFGGKFFFEGSKFFQEIDTMEIADANLLLGIQVHRTRTSLASNITGDAYARSQIPKLPPKVG